ncbi:MAG: family 20 glycosylhydrolase [Bacteroidota bacterium]
MRIALYSLLLILIFSCQNNQPTDNQPLVPTRIQWQLISNTSKTTPSALAAFTFYNDSPEVISGDNWTLYYNQTNRDVLDNPSDAATVEQIIADYYRLTPTEKFKIAPGDSLVIPFEVAAWLIKESDAPSGLYWVVGEEQIPVENYSIAPFETADQVSRHHGDKTPMHTPEWQYGANEYLSQLSKEELLPIIPTPQQVNLTNQTTKLTDEWVIRSEKKHHREAPYLEDKLKELTNLTIEFGEPAQKEISLITDPQLPSEAYKISISENSIDIVGGDEAGTFYGIQSLLNLLPPRTAGNEITLPIGTIQDAPRFPYRGMHLDVARNFQSVGAVKKLIDAMAYYKLNKLHLHLTEDEGWRLEIEDLPELTEVGARRGHDVESKTMLSPSYGSGVNEKNSGTGYYTRDQFKDILQYAQRHHIEVIPEINMPGHARAAIKSMEARYRKYMEAGDEAKATQYLLTDFDDASEYRSVQSFPDNVVCVCKESVYTFYEKVVEEVAQMYDEAGVELNMIHTGGDEVPNGVWTASPICDEFMATRDDINNPIDLSTYFLSRLEQILSERGLATAGWEEVAMKKVIEDDGSFSYIAHPDFAEKRVVPYVWQNLWGNQDLGYRLANAGYDLVLCNVTNLYFDLAYNKDPKEPGFYWGGFVDTRKPYEMIPLDVFKSTQTDPMGNTFSAADYVDMERLEPEAQSQILGIQGELWSETIKSAEMLEYYYLPKLLGLAERAWAQQPDWATTNDDDRRNQQIDQDWNQFANTIAQRELPKWATLSGGYNYRLPPPGLKIEDGLLYANSSLPGLTIRYTTDGSEPGLQSPLYTAPVEVSGTVRAKTFDMSGRESRAAETAWVE